MNEPTSVRGSTPASAYARLAAAYMISFQLYSGVTGRNGTTPTPTMPTRTLCPRARKAGPDKRLRPGEPVTVHSRAEARGEAGRPVNHRGANGGGGGGGAYRIGTYAG